VRGGRALMVAFRYLILGTLGASFYLLGIVFFYAATSRNTKTLNMSPAKTIPVRPDIKSKIRVW
ncbi:MAG TPA: hypothetical protein EYO72_05525, partial [Marine Group III euryarchaeote]|nr:hypothetical protein [Marine Group III euryarchaeote]